MLTDVVTLFPAELEVGDSIFDQTSHRWHEITRIGSGDGHVVLATEDGLDLVVPASERFDTRLTGARHDVAMEHLRPRSTVDQITEQFWD